MIEKRWQTLRCRLTRIFTIYFLLYVFECYAFFSNMGLSSRDRTKVMTTLFLSLTILSKNIAKLLISAFLFFIFFLISHARTVYIYSIIVQVSKLFQMPLKQHDKKLYTIKSMNKYKTIMCIHMNIFERNQF